MISIIPKPYKIIDNNKTIKIDGFNDVQEGDIIECIVKQQINL